MPLVIVGKETYEEKGFPAKPAAVFVPSNQSGCVLGMKKKTRAHPKGRLCKRKDSGNLKKGRKQHTLVREQIQARKNSPNHILTRNRKTWRQRGPPPNSTIQADITRTKWHVASGRGCPQKRNEIKEVRKQCPVRPLIFHLIYGFR